MSTCADLRLHDGMDDRVFLPGSYYDYEHGWKQGICLQFNNERPYHNSELLKGWTKELLPGDRVCVSVDRSDLTDPKGGTAVFSVNGAVVLGTLSLAYTADAVVVVSMKSPNAIRIVE